MWDMLSKMSKSKVIKGVRMIPLDKRHLMLQQIVFFGKQLTEGSDT